MGATYSTQQLTNKIYEDLRINVAFPYFPKEQRKGSSACCVVDTAWLEALTTDNHSNSTVILRTPKPIRSTTDGCSVKHSLTVNIYVTVLTKERASSLSMYKPSSVISGPNSSHTMLDQQVPFDVTQTSMDRFEGFIHDIDKLKDNFKDYRPIKNSDAGSIVRRIQHLLWPKCKRFRKVVSRSKELGDEACFIELEKIKESNDTDALDGHVDYAEPVHSPTDSNLPEVFAIIETEDTYYFLAQYCGTTLQDLLLYNPGILNSNFKKAFITYQLLYAIASLHSRGIVHGNLQASNILVTENLQIQIAGLEFKPDKHEFDASKILLEENKLRLNKEIEEEPLVVQWSQGYLSNFSYLMALNRMAGRREGDPNFYPILPWITDFTGDSINDGWRDLSVTKFRMNKGDEQLDFTFHGPVPHHITDIMSDITYYVYKARQTPIPVLCQFVRSKYEPNEYPVSMQRLYQWTPDECIPEFYTDPSIFKSIHPDMLDLQLPKWATSPEDFIRKHAEALESDYVSANIHHWIDLTFGIALTGKGAIEAKNVALPLIPGQNSFMKHGIIQLFKERHPQRTGPWNKQKLIPDYSSRSDTVDTDNANEAQGDMLMSLDTYNKHCEHSTKTKHSNVKTVDSSSNKEPLVLISHAVLDNMSMSSVKKERASSIYSTSSSIDTSKGQSSTLQNDTAALPLRTEAIRLPITLEEDSFIIDLEAYEKTRQFCSKYKPKCDLEIDTNPYYSHNNFTEATSENTTTDDNASIFLLETANDMVCLSNIIVAIFSAGTDKTVDAINSNYQLQPAGCYSELETGELSCDSAVIDKGDIPCFLIDSIRQIKMNTWQQKPTAKYLLSSLFYNHSPQCDGPQYGLEPTHTVPQVYKYLAELKQTSWSKRVYVADKWIGRISDLDDEAFDLLLPTICQLFSDHNTCMEAITLFPKIARRLGPEKARQHLLKRIITIFEISKPDIPKTLFEHTMIHELVKSFGISVFIQQLFPCYLEALATVCGHKTSKDQSTGTSAPSDNSKSMPGIIGEAMVYICNLLGPVLTSKFIIRQLVKALFKEESIRSTLLESIVQIISGFGSTFTSVQYVYLISLLEAQPQTHNLSKKETQTVCCILTLMRHLTPYVLNEDLVTELKSGFATRLYQLLNAAQPDDNDMQHIKDEKLRLAISMSAIECLISISRKLTVEEWETTIVTVLQKYFSTFSVVDRNFIRTSKVTLRSAQRYIQMMYCYCQLDCILPAGKMHRLIPNSEQIETIINGEFRSSRKQQIDAKALSPSFSISSSIVDRSPNRKPPEKLTPTKSDSTSASSNCSVANQDRYVSWFMSSKQSCTRSNGFSGLKDASMQGPDFNVEAVDLEKIHRLATGGLCTFGFEGSFEGCLILGAADAVTDTHSSLSSSSASHHPIPDDSTTIHVNKSKHKHMPLRKVSHGKKESYLKYSKAPISMLPWKNKWKPTQEDRRNWHRFLSTNSEEMSKTMQFSFNDLKLRAFAGHNAAIRGFAVNENSRIFASSSKDKTVKIWSLDVHQGIENWQTEPFSESLTTYTEHKRGICADVHFVIAGGSTDIVASCDGQIHLWDSVTAKALHSYTDIKSPIYTFQPILKSKYLVAGSSEGRTITMMDVHNYKPLQTWKASSVLNDSIRSTAINQNETLIAVGFSSGAISLLETRTGNLVASWKGAETDIINMKFYTEDVLLSCAQADRLISCWNVHHLALIKTISVHHDIISFDVFKDEIITVNSNNSVTFIPINDELQAYSSKFRSTIIRSQLGAFGIIPSNQLLLFGCNEGDIFLYA